MKRSPDEIDFEEFYEDWRHRDRLTWQIPSVVIVVGGALIVGAYAAEVCWQIAALVFGLGAFFAATMTTMLAQNLYYQWRDGKHLESFGKQKLSSPRSRPIPLIAPGEQKDDHLCTKLGRIVGPQRLGSTLLLTSCFSVFIVLFVLFVGHSIITGGWWPAIVICIAIILPFLWFLVWLIKLFWKGEDAAS